MLLGREREKKEKKHAKQSIPGSSSMMLRASMAAAASMGGKDAEKQYPWPDRRYKTQERLILLFTVTAKKKTK